ncbi:MAG: hypothetical protein QXG02_01480 [Candidatus Anstonellales archaeon]
MKKIGGGMMFLAFYLGMLGCSPCNKNISKLPPIVENLMDGTMQKYDTTKKGIDLGVVPKKDTSKIDTMQALPPVDCPDLEKLAEPPRIKKQ